MRASQQSGPSSRRRVRIGIATGIAAALCLGSLSAAAADDDTPTREDIREAKRDVAQKAEDVGELKAQLEETEQQVISLGVEAGRMAEAYNGARYRLQQARRAERKADRAVRIAKRRLDRTADRVADALAMSASDTSALSAMTALLEQNGPREMLEQASGLDSINDAMAAQLKRYDARRQVYAVLDERAQRTVGRREQLIEQARAAKAEADAAATAAQEAAAGLRAERGELIAELAAAQGTSKRLVRERQRDLAEQARREALRQAREEQRGQDPPKDRSPEREQETQPQREQTEPRSEQETQPRTDPPPEREDTEPRDTEPPRDDPPERNDDPRPRDDNDRPKRHENKPRNNTPRNNTPRNKTPPPDRGPSRGAEAAIAYAKAQLGEPYSYGAAGPSSWDCSGLTMMAWNSAGVSLPHWSVAQYDAVSPVSTSAIRRGDLLFWSQGSSDSIYHVAMYLGNGMMIHAPRPGRNVEIVPISYWIAPDLAGRVTA